MTFLLKISNSSMQVFEFQEAVAHSFLSDSSIRSDTDRDFQNLVT